MVRVGIVDDSAVVRQQLSQLLTQAGFEVAFTASDPLFAWPKIRSNPPDVLVLDVEMPRMDGISFLRQLMSEHPLPVVMCSTLTQKGAETTLQAMGAGAVSFVTKPKIGLRDFLSDDSNELIPAVRAAAGANLKALPKSLPMPAQAQHNPPVTSMVETTDRILAVGSSTGGVQTFENLLLSLPPTLPAGIVWVQHMPAGFTASLAERLDRISGFKVREAQDGDRVLAGQVLIAPGGRHMQLQRNGAQYRVEVKDGPLINHHRPSVDVLFRSVARCAGSNAVGVLLTGMGEDGARGLLDMRKAGALTLAQDEATSVVYGMPKAAFDMGAAVRSLPLGAMAECICEPLSKVSA